MYALNTVVFKLWFGIIQMMHASECVMQISCTEIKMLTQEESTSRVRFVRGVGGV